MHFSYELSKHITLAGELENIIKMMNYEQNHLLGNHIIGSAAAILNGIWVARDDFGMPHVAIRQKDTNELYPLL